MMKVNAFVRQEDSYEGLRFVVECSNCFAEKDTLKAQGFKWNPFVKIWEKGYTLRVLTKEELCAMDNYETDEPGIIPEDILSECKGILAGLNLEAEVEIC